MHGDTQITLEKLLLLRIRMCTSRAKRNSPRACETRRPFRWRATGNENSFKTSTNDVPPGSFLELRHHVTDPSSVCVTVFQTSRAKCGGGGPPAHRNTCTCLQSVFCLDVMMLCDVQKTRLRHFFARSHTVPHAE